VDGELACFVGEANLIDGLLDGGVVDTALGKLHAHWHGAPSPAPCPVTVLIRPEQIAVHAVNGEPGPVGRVVRSGYHGHDTVLEVRLGSEHDGSLVLVRTLGNAQLSPGESVALSARGPVLVWPQRTERSG
jgi:iron(III) transport system ATP-binding protein